MNKPDNERHADQMGIRELAAIIARQQDALEGQCTAPGAVRCATCGEYLPGHASGAADICTCPEPPQGAAVSAERRIEDALLHYAIGKSAGAQQLYVDWQYVAEQMAAALRETGSAAQNTTPDTNGRIMPDPAHPGQYIRVWQSDHTNAK